MKSARFINPSDVRMLHFGNQDALENNDAREARKRKLNRAIALRSNAQTTVNLYLKLPTGEIVETQSDVIDYADNFVVLKGGHFIPERVILDIA